MKTQTGPLRNQSFYNAYVKAKLSGRKTFRYGNCSFYTDSPEIEADFNRDRKLGYLSVQVNITY